MVIRKVTRLAASLFLSCCVFLTQAQAENPKEWITCVQLFKVEKQDKITNQ